MNIKDLDKALDTLSKENNPANITLIEFYERKRIELVEQISYEIYEKLKGVYAS